MVLCAAQGCNNRSDRGDSSARNALSDGDSTDALRDIENTPPDENNPTSSNANNTNEKEMQKYQHLKEKLTFHPFPQCGSLRDSWVAAFNREKKCLTKYSKLCSAHFTPDCFEDTYWLKFDMGLTLPRSRKLKEDAVPSLFIRPAHTRIPKERLHTVERLRRQSRKEMVASMMDVPDCTLNDPVPEKDATNDTMLYHPNFNSISTQTDEILKPQVKMTSIGTWANIADPSLTLQQKVTTKTTGTQTIKEEPVINNTYGMPWKISHDHSYVKQTQVGNTDNQLSDNCMMQPEDVEMISEDDEIEMEDDVSKDPTWEPNQNISEHMLCDDEEDEAEEVMDEEESVTPVSDKKYIVFGSQLQDLLKFCPRCGSLVMERKMTTKGSMLTVQLVCSQSHSVKWRSQPVLNYYPLGNVLLSAACLFAGSTYTRLHQMCEFLGLQVPKPGTFFQHQQNIIFPVIAGAWRKKKKELMTEMSSRENEITLIGDGRCDSPGYSAKYGTYTMMDSVTSKIAEFEVVQVTEVASSVAMEKEGLKRVLNKIDLADPRVKIHTVATDRHSQIAKFMEKEHPDKTHQFDVWHFSKNISSRLSERAKLKRHAILRPWIQCISNHLWWSAATCGGNKQELRERWTSIVYHVTDVHQWDTATVYHKCEHAPLQDEDRENLWLKPGSPSHKVLQDIVFDDKLLKAIDKLTKFCHTGPLEVAHSLYLKYCPKRQHFSYKGMVARTMLAALDNNHNVGRQQATVKQGDKAGEKRYDIVFPKGRKRWVAKPVREKKDYVYLKDMMKSVVNVCANTATAEEIGQIAVPDLPSNISRTTRPIKEQVVQQQKSRMQMHQNNAA